ncbi:ribosome maturation factor RimM [Motilibacter peucedani]|uniref:ribosome maturation factor RimM n=1 Tax=Motilibacter peucedani TaxID=598650 RepID=UPI000EAD06FA
MELSVGRIGRAHGIRGDVLVEPRTDDPGSRFAPGVVLRTDPAATGPLTVESARWQSGRLVVRFAGVDDRSAAEALRGTLLVVDIDEHESLDDPDEFYDHQLVGLAAVTVAGDPVGTVSDVLHLPAQDVLAITRPDGREVLVPFVSELVPAVDLDAGQVQVEPIGGLLDPED